MTATDTSVCVCVIEVMKVNKTMYVCVIEARSCNHSCSGKAITRTYSASVFVALRTHHAMRTRHIVIFGLSGSTVLSTLSQNGTIFGKPLMEHKMCVICSLQLSFLRSQRETTQDGVPSHVFKLRMDIEKVSTTHCLLFELVK